MNTLATPSRGAVVEASHAEAERRLPELTAVFRRLQHKAQQARAQREQLVDAIAAAGPAAGVLAKRLEDLDECTEHAAARQQELQAEIAAGRGAGVDVDHLREALADFDPSWTELFPREQIRVLRLLIEEVRHDARTTEVSITFRPAGVQALAAELQGAGR
jgi:ABC-type transporter Mla subunit MlaD